MPSMPLDPQCRLDYISSDWWVMQCSGENTLDSISVIYLGFLSIKRAEGLLNEKSLVVAFVPTGPYMFCKS